MSQDGMVESAKQNHMEKLLISWRMNSYDHREDPW